MEIRKSPINWQLVIVVALVVAGAALRLLPHVPNVAPVGAIALFGGAMLSWRLAVWLPLAVMLLSDLVLGFYPGIEFTWAGFLIVALYGMTFRGRSLPVKVLVGGLGSGLLFYVVSNFGTWLVGGMYPPTFEGLVQCYVMGLPFLQATLTGDMLYGLVLFGTYETVWRFVSFRLYASVPPLVR